MSAGCDRVCGRRGVPTLCLALALPVAGLMHTPTQAQEFSRLLHCEGSFTTATTSAPAYTDLALRHANRTALIQASNVLPVGERLQYTPSAATYSMSLRLPTQGTTIVAVPGWLQNTVLVMLPDPSRLNEIRMSVDRRSGALEGVLLNEQQEGLGSFGMHCTAADEQQIEAPKF